jgi:hypothetical protein
MVFTFLIEGRGLGPALADMERSGRVRVLGSKLDRRTFAGTHGDRERMMLMVEAESVRAGRDFLWDYLQGKGHYAVHSDLRALLKPR